MTSDDFDFRPPAPRREPRRFEPPPWERDALERIRKDEQAQAEPEKARQGIAPGESTQSQVDTRSEAREQERPAAPPRDEDGKVDERAVVEMLAELSAEDPPATRSWASVYMAAALVLGPLGAMMLIWAIAAFVGQKEAGALAVYIGLVVLIFGVGFMAGAAWLVYKAMRQRGVL